MHTFFLLLIAQVYLASSSENPAQQLATKAFADAMGLQQKPGLFFLE